jgi:hypothetical protein
MPDLEKNGAGAAAPLILELLPEPVLVVQGGDGDAPEITYGNRAAREVFRIELAGAPLGAALRRPEVLETIEAALESGGSAEVAFETIGVQPRFWRAFARPLATGEARACPSRNRCRPSSGQELRRTRRCRRPAW